MANFEIKSVEMTTAEGKRNTVVCNGIRTQAYNKVMSVLQDAGFDAVRAANGDIAIALVTDTNSGETYYLRLAVSLSAKALDSTVAKKPAAKKDPVEVPSIF